jgi:nucleoporin SEH1
LKALNNNHQAHDAAISKLSWAHPEFGSIIASASFDRTVKIWEQVSIPESEHQSGVNAGSQAYLSGTSRWVERAILSDAKGTVRSVEFCPHYFGLKLVRFFIQYNFHSKLES